jgi:branched-subunit amino acid ABC-type transport system permease component
MGFRALLLGMTGVIVGGVGTVPGAALGSMVISIAVNVGAWMLPTHWQDGIVFAILVLFLILRPQGFLGKPLRRATV